MGMNMQLSIEAKLAGVWQHYGHPDIDRDHTLYKRLAGVKGTMADAIVPPRGLPKDMTLVTWALWKDREGDWHTPSWINAYEIQAMAQWGELHLKPGRGAYLKHWTWEQALNSYLFGQCFSSFYQRHAQFPPALQDLRFVFWFD